MQLPTFSCRYIMPLLVNSTAALDAVDLPRLGERLQCIVCTM